MGDDNNINSEGDDGDDDSGGGKCDSSFPMSNYLFYLLLDKQLTHCLRHHFYYNIFLCILYAFVFTVGILSNLIVISVIICRPRMRNNSNWFIVNMAVSNLCSVLIGTPAQISDNLFSTWLFDGATCKLAHYFQPVFLFSSVYSVVAYAIDRWQSLCRPLGTRRGLSKSQTRKAILFIWTSALLLHLPYVFVYQVAPLAASACQEIWASDLLSQLYFFIVPFLLGYLVPIFLLVMLVVIMNVNVRDHQVPSPQQHHLRTLSTSVLVVRQASRKFRLQTVKMLAAMTFAYFICSLFYNLVKLMFVLGRGKDNMETIETILPIVHLAHYSGNSFLNSILFGMMHDSFLDALCLNRSIAKSWQQRFNQDDSVSGSGGGGSIGDIRMTRITRRMTRHDNLEWQGEEENDSNDGQPSRAVSPLRSVAVALPQYCEDYLEAMSDFEEN